MLAARLLMQATATSVFLEAILPSTAASGDCVRLSPIRATRTAATASGHSHEAAERKEQGTVANLW